MIATQRIGLRTTFLALLAAVGSSGCGDDTGLAKRYAVSGKVTYKGQPVEKGTISFMPENRPKAGPPPARSRTASMP